MTRRSGGSIRQLAGFGIISRWYESLCGDIESRAGSVADALASEGSATVRLVSGGHSGACSTESTCVAGSARSFDRACVRRFKGSAYVIVVLGFHVVGKMFNSGSFVGQGSAVSGTWSRRRRNSLRSSCGSRAPGRLSRSGRQMGGSPDGSVIGHMWALRDILARRVVGAVEVSPFPSLADHGPEGCWFGGTCGALGG